MKPRRDDARLVIPKYQTLAPDELLKLDQQRADKERTAKNYAWEVVCGECPAQRGQSCVKIDADGNAVGYLFEVTPEKDLFHASRCYVWALREAGVNPHNIPGVR